MPLVATRRSHYEVAFEAYLNRRGTPYVSVDDVRPMVRERLGMKAFDYIVYPSGGPAWLVDVKGRKSVGGRQGDGAEWRQKNWVTRSDLEGLAEWQQVFGAEFQAAFVFAYWLSDFQPQLWTAGDGPDAAAGIHLILAGRAYGFWLIRLEDYARFQHRLSARWDTVAVPREAFRRLAMPLDRSWPPAPC